MSKAWGAFSTWSTPAPSLTEPGVMRIGWKLLLPLSIANLLAYTVGIYFLQA